jgi:hypothetical protein
LLSLISLAVAENANINLLEAISKRVDPMANKFTTYVPNHSPNHIEIVGLVMIYVTCYLSQCVYCVNLSTCMDGLMVSTFHMKNEKHYTQQVLPSSTSLKKYIKYNNIGRFWGGCWFRAQRLVTTTGRGCPDGGETTITIKSGRYNNQ